MSDLVHETLTPKADVAHRKELPVFSDILKAAGAGGGGQPFRAGG